MTQKILILGAGGNSIDILDTLNDLNAARGERVYECVGFLDDDAEQWGREILGARVLGGLDRASQYADSFFVNGIAGINSFWRKREIIARTQMPRERFATLIHPTASVSRTAQIGNGVVIFQNVTITSNVVIGDHVIVLPQTVISHDNVIGDYTSIAGGVAISGNVRVGEACYLGANASIKDGVVIGAGSLIGMGSVVLKNVAANTVVVGNPARELRKTRLVHNA
ncbi:MAG: sugar O-acyltransferase [Chloroflexi bacterium UTCFX4]|jgi:sugar O-acyltransferase (sialic acid O-acetyltransferase NeuD family)|nr:MAG: sugar O-acyltransferase [Chloroflexi bacterium UTCFX4]